MKKIGVLFLGIFLLFTTGCGAPQKAATSKAPELKMEFYSTSQGLPHNFVTCVAFFGGQMWVGTKSGLARFDGVNWQIHMKKNTNVLGSDMIEGFHVSDSAIFIATEYGVCKFDGNRWNTVFTGSRARSVAVKGPQIAIATAHGIENSTGSQFSAYAKSNAGLVFDEVNVVQFDESGKLWAGTRAGMAQFNGSMFQNFTGPQKTVMGTSLVDVPPSPANCQLVGNNIKCIIPYNKQIAIGTVSGLSITDMGNSWASYFSTHRDWIQRGGEIIEEEISGNSPLPGNSIAALAAVPKREILFIGTNKGIIGLHKTKWVEIQPALTKLRTGQINALALEGDVLLVGTPDGVLRVEGVLSLFPPPENTTK